MQTRSGYVHARASKRRTPRNGGAEERGVADNASGVPQGRKILLRLYLFSTFFPSPGRTRDRERERGRERESISPPRVTRPFLPLFSLPLLVLSPSLRYHSTFLPLRTLRAVLFLSPGSLPLRLCLEMWHSTGLPRCLRWRGIRAGLPLRARDRRGGPRGGASGK